MRALVTGACGFVGGHLLRHLLDSGDEAFGTYLLGEFTRIDGVTYLPLDITSLEGCKAVIDQVKPDIVYHLAGLAFVPDADKDFVKTLAINVGGVHNIVKALGDLKHDSRFLLISSAEVYGLVPSSEMPIGEEHAICPANSYSLSKVFAEMVLSGANKRVTPVIVRPFNHIGPGQDPRFMASSFARQLAEIAKGRSAPIIRVGNLDAQRDFTDVRDVVRAYRSCALKGEGIYNVGSGKPTKVADILSKLIEASGQIVTVEVDPERFRPLERPVVYGDSEKIFRSLGWKPLIDLKTTLSDVYQYWLKKVS